MRRSSRFQTGGSQKSKDAIKEHVVMVDKIVRKYHDKLFNRKLLPAIISQPQFLENLIDDLNVYDYL